MELRYFMNLAESHNKATRHVCVPSNVNWEPGDVRQTGVYIHRFYAGRCTICSRVHLAISSAVPSDIRLHSRQHVAWWYGGDRYATQSVKLWTDYVPDPSLVS